ncbi:hypothetical protein [Fictibacillus arsenicus]|nr:hypothetical protein [Fictibacillus arsenicus]
MKETVGKREKKLFFAKERINIKEKKGGKYFMRMSARMIGEKLGMTVKEVYLLVKDKDFLDGEEGNWSLTELGRQVGGQVRQKDNGEGGFCRRTWSVLS